MMMMYQNYTLLRDGVNLVLASWVTNGFMMSGLLVLPTGTSYRTIEIYTTTYAYCNI